MKSGYADLTDLPKGDTAEEKDYTLSSLRLDAFAAAVCGLSREKAARIIRAEQVTVDHVTVTETSANLREGATVTVRSLTPEAPEVPSAACDESSSGDETKPKAHKKQKDFFTLLVSAFGGGCCSANVR